MEGSDERNTPYSCKNYVVYDVLRVLIRFHVSEYVRFDIDHYRFCATMTVRMPRLRTAAVKTAMRTFLAAKIYNDQFHFQPVSKRKQSET